MPNGEVVIVLERSITKDYWEPTQAYIERRFDAGKYRKVGGSGVIEVHGSKCATCYSIVDGNEPVSWLYLRRRPNWACWEVAQAYTLKEHRGNGLATRLYKAIVNADEQLLATGKSHTRFSMGVWKKFVKEGTFRIWAHDFSNLDRTAEVVVEDGELVCPLQIYKPTANGRADVRLVAMKK